VQANPTGSTEPPASYGAADKGSSGQTAPSLARKLGLFDITMLVMGSVIGAGIFVVPHDVAELVRLPWLVLAAWAVGGLVTLSGSLVYAELSRRRPEVGGQYAFLREAYHPSVAFLYGWSLLCVLQSGGLASVAVVFGRYFMQLIHSVATSFGWWATASEVAQLSSKPAESPLAERVAACAALGVLTLINCLGVRTGSTAQNIFMILKILAIGAVIVSGLVFLGGWAGASLPAQPTVVPSADVTATADVGEWLLLIAFGAALVRVMFAYGGSHTTTFVTGEVRDPQRTMPRGLILGIFGVTALYLAVNFVCLEVLGVDRLAASKSPASDVMARTWGPGGAALISIGIAISALGFLSQGTLTSPRVYYAMARDGVFFRAVAWVHPRTRVPVIAVLLQGLFAVVIALSGTFDEILKYVMSVEMIFLSLTALSLFVLRRRDAAATAAGAAAMPGHPLTTLLFAAVNLALVANLFYTAPVNSTIGLGIALAGVPVYLYWRLRERRR
jgi:APA family basic amino acid/polyamine antiporter